ncbi:MAG: hypothetical protein U0Y10_17815 [Spirosomataceae bacterium]
MTKFNTILIIAKLVFLSFLSTAQKIDTISVKESYNYIGKEVVLKGKVLSARRVESIKGIPTFFNFKEDTTHFTVLLWNDVAQLFKSRPDTTFKVGTFIKAKGKIELYKGKDQLVIRDPKNLN